MATADDWKHLPFGQVTAIPYSAEFSATQFDILRRGLVPEVMEDKWFIYYAEPDLAFHRSWTGQAVYRVTLQPVASGYSVAAAVRATVGAELCNHEYEAELLGFLISNLLLGEHRAFPVSNGVSEPVPGLYQHAVAGTGYIEKVVSARPWWKFWL